ncbi:hypothetical protein [Lentibacillus juripiscarius]|uniref:Uncharacterized protein n=1 Tax=Lentibacillus juripiscarius TaxID=257446 RepID=A0ABW5V1U9_9BACI
MMLMRSLLGADLGVAALILSRIEVSLYDKGFSLVGEAISFRIPAGCWRYQPDRGGNQPDNGDYQPVYGRYQPVNAVINQL